MLIKDIKKLCKFWTTAIFLNVIVGNIGKFADVESLSQEEWLLRYESQ